MRTWRRDGRWEASLHSPDTGLPENLGLWGSAPRDSPDEACWAGAAAAGREECGVVGPQSSLWLGEYKDIGDARDEVSQRCSGVVAWDQGDTGGFEACTPVTVSQACGV